MAAPHRPGLPLSEAIDELLNAPFLGISPWKSLKDRSSLVRDSRSFRQAGMGADKLLWEIEHAQAL